MNLFASVANPILIPLFQDAYKFYIKLDVNDKLRLYSLAILGRYLLVHDTIKDMESFYAAGMYIANRHPYSYPNHETKSQFAKRTQVRISSMQWYNDAIITKLGFIKIHDNRHYPYYIDPEGIIYRVLHGIVKDAATESTVKQLLGKPIVEYQKQSLEIASQLTARLKLIPAVFKVQLEGLVQRLFQETFQPNNGS